MKGVAFFLLFIACCSGKEYTPKPRGYFRIEPPAAIYLPLSVKALPYSFSVSNQVTVELSQKENEHWINLNYTAFNAKVYCSYLPITKAQISKVVAESIDLAERLKAKVRASAYEDPDKKVYGIFFQLEGDAPSPIQFYLTDSISHFFRGALYYNQAPNRDSLAPMTEYLQKDIIELIQSFSWKN
ncbi:MAG: gliding motility protein GldD [Massilibacteroides sp.]|nr:gliding motility protein GldD [Massilibacteroides sp.]